MSVSSVPPGRASPYQKGEAASAKAVSLKPLARQAVLSGTDASFVPRKNRQVAFVLNRTAPSAIDAHSRIMKIIARENTAGVWQIAWENSSANMSLRADW